MVQSTVRFLLIYTKKQVERMAPDLRDASLASKNFRGRRAKSGCKNLHYQKTKIQGAGQEPFFIFNTHD